MKLTNNKVKIKDVLRSTSATAPEQGDKIFEILLPLFNSQDLNQVIIDFQGLDIFTSGFVNNAIGKLFFSINPATVLDKISITGIRTEDDFDIIRDTLIESLSLRHSLKK